MSWVLLLLILALRHPNRRWIALASLAIGMALLAGYMQGTFYVMSIGAAYTLFSAWRSRSFRPVVLLVVSCTLGAALAAVYIWSFLDIVGSSARTSNLDYSTFMKGTIPLRNIITFLVPDFFGHPASQEPVWGGKAYAEGTTYFGAIPFLIALLAPVWRRDLDTLFFWGAFLISACVAYGILFTPILHHLPIIAMFRNERALMVVCLCGSLLAGLCLDKVVDLARARRSLLAVSALCIGFALGIRQMLEVYDEEIFPCLATATASAGFAILSIAVLILALFLRSQPRVACAFCFCGPPRI